MITVIEAEQLANEARKRADRSAEVETLIDAAITKAAGAGEMRTVDVSIPAELATSIDLALVRYRAVGWTATIAGNDRYLWRVELTIVRRRGGDAL